MDASFFGSVARFRFGPTLPPFHPPTPWRTVSRADPARPRCFALLLWPWSRVPLTLHSLLAVSLALASSPSQLPSVDCRRPQPTWSIFSCESHDLRWLGRPLLYPLRSRFEFLSSSSITCPPNSPALSCPASAHSTSNRFIGTLLPPPASDRIDAGSSAAPEPRSARLRPSPLPSSSIRRRSALSGPVCSLSVASDRACI